MSQASVPALARPRLHWAGDALVLVEFDARIAPEINRRAVALAEAITAARVPGVRDVVPAYSSVGVHVDPLRFDASALDAVISHDWDRATTPDDAAARVVEIPVCYGGAFGPDLDEVAAFAQLSPDQVIATHAAGTYRVYMLGFLPGFAYLGGVDAAIAMPRRESPRTAVPVGSVGIAGVQTGVYPTECPGGWRLIGRTPVAMFDVARAQPALLQPGDRVRFVPLAHDRFDEGGPGRPA
ncbi:MAG: 5-oxoprolinase subunit PxpB [Vicinamibacterales bacterium]